MRGCHQRDCYELNGADIELLVGPLDYGLFDISMPLPTTCGDCLLLTKDTGSTGRDYSSF
jgi:hypothetical protein